MTNGRLSSAAPLVSIIIPVYNGADTLPACLAAIRASDYRNYEVILVDDASTDQSAAIGEARGCQVIGVNGRHGAAHCRNVGAAAARGEVLLWIDADVVIQPWTIQRAVQSLADGRWDAVFGSYSLETPAPGFFSQFHNLLHHYTHQHSQERAVTFWTGCGAVLRKAFDAVGGFDERHPPLEDMALGYALSAAGFRIRLDKQMQVTHLKRHSFLKLLRAYLFGRAVPWTRIMLLHRTFRNDLNTKPEHVLSVALAFLLPLFALGAVWHWLALFAACGTELGLLWANRMFLGFLRRERGWWFAARGALQLHLFYIVCGIGAVGGLLSYWRFLCRHPERRQLQSSASAEDERGKLPSPAIGVRGECQSE